MYFRTLIILMAASLCGCGPDGTVIVNKDPFFQTTFQLSEGNDDGFIHASEDFASDHGLTFTINKFGEGKFSILMYDRKPANLNLGALNTVVPGQVRIDAIATEAPTAGQARLATAYVAAVRPFTSRG